MVVNWKCPYCNHAATITGNNQSYSVHKFNDGNYTGADLGVSVKTVVCPNAECKQVVLTVTLGKTRWANGHTHMDGVAMERWSLLPASSAIPFPQYVPLAIRQDYEEACKIVNLSAKASATLSRRCLQGMIRDFWNIKKGRLVDEIAALEDKVDPDTWAAIDAVRTIGNIGAHMEKDINTIIEVDPDEAALLIELIETLIKDWYITRHQRQERLARIKAVADAKK
ncbi:DUF4145 domain-containing protein [Pseudomonas pudica]|uniref:DUF4145 domain-containing protein n=1 Tax=Pseudomonas pudica TaxID=272772 RepID=UPI00320AF0B3